MKRRGEILVVDDDPDICLSLRVILENDGYAVRTARNGSEALRILETWRGSKASYAHPSKTPGASLGAARGTRGIFL